MPFVIALAVREMRMTSAEALVAATVGGARALRRGDIGRIAVGGAPIWRCSRRRRMNTWPTGRGCRSPEPSTCPDRRARGRNRRWQTN
jgi:hypothetical protein